MRIAIEGCTHGELEKTYQTIKQIEERDGQKVDLLLCCGDFQSTRNLSDLACMAVPDKYKSMCSFYKYYNGEAIAPVLTIFIGGNHEASNYLQELAYGGWVAPNIFYLGYAGVIEVGGVRIGGLSGIYKGYNYLHGHHEKPPYDDNTSRSAYHIRNVDVFRLKQLSDNPPDIMLSHDWPRGVTDHGDVARLLRYKKHFADDISQDRLGSPPARDIMDSLKPRFWFSAHLHCKFAAVIPHEGSDVTTKFLALDKCLPRRQFLQVVNIGAEIGEEDTVALKYCPQWLAILRSTNHLLSVERKSRYTPGPGSSERFDFRPTEEEVSSVKAVLKDDLEVPLNFERTALAYKDTGEKINMRNVPQPQGTTNGQTTILCSQLGIHDPMALLLGHRANNLTTSANSYSYSYYSNEKITNDSEIDISGIPDDDENENKRPLQSEEKEEETKSKLNPLAKSWQNPLAMPTPKNDKSQEEFQAVMKSMTVSQEPSQEEPSLFVIDTQGATGGGECEKPIKKLKRRNAAIYNDGE